MILSVANDCLFCFFPNMLSLALDVAEGRLLVPFMIGVMYIYIFTPKNHHFLLGDIVRLQITARHHHIVASHALTLTLPAFSWSRNHCTPLLIPESRLTMGR